MLSVFMEGLLLQASLIFALGAQNLFILESGLRRDYHLTASVVCYLCDFVIIMLGVAGAATLFTSFPAIKILVGLLGVYFLFSYGFEKLRPQDGTVFCENLFNRKKCLKRCILAALTFSVLNPHAFLDGIVLIGGYSAKYDDLHQRLLLGFGASTFSLIWFLLLSSASAKLMPFLKSPQRMRFVMSCAGVSLIVLSAKLSFDVFGWMSEVLKSREIPQSLAIIKVGYFQSIMY